jgi:uncharacterized protein (TIGR02391 family)
VNDDVTFSLSQLEAIADALGDTADGLTGPEIGLLLANARIGDVAPGITKRKTLRDETGTICASFGAIRAHARASESQPRIRGASGGVERRTGFERTRLDAPGRHPQGKDLRADLSARGAHPDVLAFCRSELVADNYFHAVLEATRSVAAKLRDRTGLTDDGAALVDRALGGNPPMLAINALTDDSQVSEQRGFANLVKGMFGMFRNTTAHAPRMNWNMTRRDAEDLLTLASLIHRRLDAAVMPARL